MKSRKNFYFNPSKMIVVSVPVVRTRFFFRSQPMKPPILSVFFSNFFMINPINECLMNSKEIRVLWEQSSESNRVVFRCVHRTSPSLLESPCHSKIVLGRRSSSLFSTPKQCVELSEVCSISKEEEKEEASPYENYFDCDYGYLALPIDFRYSYP